MIFKSVVLLIDSTVDLLLKCNESIILFSIKFVIIVAEFQHAHTNVLQLTFQSHLSIGYVLNLRVYSVLWILRLSSS